MANRIQYRRDVASQWTSENPVLAVGEPGYETDTGNVKIGDGTTSWTSLGYSGGGGGGSGTVTSVDTGTNLSGGPITTSGTITMAADLTGVNSVTSANNTPLDIIAQGGTLTLQTDNSNSAVISKGTESEGKLEVDRLVSGNVVNSIYDAGTITSDYAPDLHNGLHQKVVWHGDVNLNNPTNVGVDGERGSITIIRDQDNIVNAVGTNWIRENINGSGQGADLTNIGDSSGLSSSNIDVTVVDFITYNGKCMYVAKRHGPFAP